MLEGFGSSKKNEESRVENAQQVIDRYNKYSEHMKDYPDVMAKSSGFQASFDAWKSQSDKLVKAAGNVSQVELDELRKEESKKFSALRDKLDAAGEAALNKSAEVREELAAQLQEVEAIAIVVLGLVLLFALTVAYLIPKKISQHLHRTIEVANQIAAGNLSNKIESSSSDEIGQLLSSMQRMQDTIQLLLHDMQYMSTQHKAGDIEVLVDEKKFKGDYNELAHAINNMVTEHIHMNQKAMAVFKAFGQGEFDADIEKLPGKKAFINESIETVRNNLKAVSDDTKLLVQAVANGQLNKSVDASQFQGDWKLMIEGMNQILGGIVEPINEAIEVLNEIEKGNLTQTIKGDYKGQLGEFKTTVNNTVAKLSNVIQHTTHASQMVSKGAQEVAQGALDLRSRVNQQATTLEQTTSAMDAITSSVKSNAQNAQESTKVVQVVQDQSHTGTQVMSQTIDAMNAIQESSHKISDIVTMIDGIAFQTNLLALNAAVEAARAGEHGRGFAVVAGEVRSLSQKSADAAREINALISESVERIDQGTKLASETSEVLSNINASIDDIVKVVEHVEQSSTEQMQSISQVHQAISQIDTVTHQNASLVEQTAATADGMSEQADNLDKDMSFFRIS